MDTINLDSALADVGSFGRYQTKRYFLFCILIVFTTFPTLGYIFTTHNPNYRCFVEECDGLTPSYREEWLSRAIPFNGDEPSRCLRYASELDCNATSSTNETRHCEKLVYENDNKTTIARDFDILCDENLWKLTIVGTINNIGFIVGLPLSGYFSDRYGRRLLMITSVLASTILGVIKSFSVSYTFFVILEFLDMCLASGTYSATYILGMELLIPKHRVVASTIMSCAFALGEAYMGLIAWNVSSWRVFLRVLYAPGLIFVFYYWMTDESIRWLLSKQKQEKANDILKKIAKENNRLVKISSMKALNGIKQEVGVERASDSFIDVFHSPILFLRLLNCSFGWICCTFVYYGLTMHSVGISGNMYINFIAVALIEIPAYITTNFCLDRIGRRYSLSFSFLLSGVACIGFVFTPEDVYIMQLVLFLTGKFAVTIAYTTIYLYTTEMFPTSLRHSFMSCCSTFGRIGSMIAPQVPILAKISKSLPLIMFGVMATTSGLLSLLHPETLNVNLPDTIEDAENIGRRQRSNAV